MGQYDESGSSQSKPAQKKRKKSLVQLFVGIIVVSVVAFILYYGVLASDDEATKTDQAKDTSHTEG